jgi:hypothetical protein
MADNQINAKTLRFIESLGLHRRVHFAVDPGSAAIDRLGVRLENPMPIEAGVPHPTTLLVDRCRGTRSETWSSTPRASAARSRVPRVTDSFVGSRRRSNAARLVAIRSAISVFVRRSLSIDRPICQAIVSLIAALVVSS